MSRCIGDKKIINKKTEDKNIRRENINAIHEGMRSVAEEEGGTAYSVFKDFAIELGGKTGSAEYNKVNFILKGILEMVKDILSVDKPESWLDYRESEPMWIQFKFQKSEFDLEKLQSMAIENNNVLTCQYKDGEHVYLSPYFSECLPECTLSTNDIFDDKIHSHKANHQQHLF